MTISLPDVRFYIKPPNGTWGDYSKFVAYNGGSGGISFTQNFGRQGDTGSFTLTDPYYSSETLTSTFKHAITVSPSFTIKAFSQVRIIDQSIASLPQKDQFNNGVIFSGYVSNPSLKIPTPSLAEWNLACVDYSGYANSSVVYGQYEGLMMQDLVVDLVNQADCGIKAAKVSDGGFVHKGPVIPRMVFPHTNLTQALQRVSKMASTTSAYGWYVDENRNLHFYDQNQATQSGVLVTDVPTKTTLSATEAHIAMDGSMTYEFDGQSLYNRAVVTGATTTVRPKVTQETPTQTVSKTGRATTRNVKTFTTPTDVWISSGGQASYPLSYVPDPRAHTPTIIVGSSFLSVGYNDGTAVPTEPWQIVQAANGSWSLQVNFASGGVIPPPGTYINIWYAHQTSITAQADNLVSQRAIGGPNHGVFATAINQRSITTSSGAYQRAVREITEYGHPQERISFTTTPDFIGVWRAGQTFQLYATLLLDSQSHFNAPLNATFLITQASVNFTDQGFRTWSVTAVRVG